MEVRDEPVQILCFYMVAAGFAENCDVGAWPRAGSDLARSVCQMARHSVGYFLDSGYLPYDHQFPADVTVEQPARQASHPTTKGLNLTLRCLTFGSVLT